MRALCMDFVAIDSVPSLALLPELPGKLQGQVLRRLVLPIGRASALLACLGGPCPAHYRYRRTAIYWAYAPQFDQITKSAARFRNGNGSETWVRIILGSSAPSAPTPDRNGTPVYCRNEPACGHNARIDIVAVITKTGDMPSDRFRDRLRCSKW